MITLADNRVIVIGGQDGKEASRDIFELICDFQLLVWIVIGMLWSRSSLMLDLE